MTHRRWFVSLFSTFAAVAFASPAPAQGPAPKPVPHDEAKLPPREGLIKKAEEFIKPLPPDPIPDDPPPHEGAMLEISPRIQPPDLILVEVLEPLPGRPISGERLVRPDGAIHLGSYGEVHVAGLTPRQAKVKIVLHLRNFLRDTTLGLVRYDETGKALDVSRLPIEIPEERMAPPWPIGVDAADDMPPLPRALGPVNAAPRRGANRAGAPGRRRPRPAITPPAATPPSDELGKQEDPNTPAKPELPPELVPETGTGRYVPVDPADSRCVFVDLAAYHSQVYYTAGDVGLPGRLTWTGYETVLDAINFGGGILPLVGDRHKVQLHRPARGKQPAKTYHIDLDAIERGDKTANLQIFPGDRLVVGRKAELPPR